MSRMRRIIALALLAAVAAAEDPWDQLSAAAKAQPAAEAQRQLQALLLEHPNFHAAHYDLGTLLLKDDPAAAAEHLQAATAALDRGLAADAWHNLALALLAQGRLDEALAAAVRAADLNPALGEDRDRIRSAVLVAKDEARRKAEEEAKKLRLPHAELPRGAVGEAYEAHVAAAGGAGGYRFAVAGKTVLPKGLELEADGRLHGTPEAAQRSELTLTVTDSAKASATGTVTLQVLPPPAITTEKLPEAVVGQPYRAELACTGLEQARWSAEHLPAGLAVEPTTGDRGAIAGTPTAAGEVDVVVTAADDRHHATRTLHLVVSDSFAPDLAELPPATVWAQYQHRIGVRGPAVEYRWQLAEPVTGLTLASDGTLGGAPENEGRLTVPVTIGVADGRSRRFELTLPVNPAPVIDEAGTITVTQGRPVERPLKAHGGTAPFAWSVADGSLPNGLRLDADGALRGATTATGKSEVTVALKDRWQAATQKRLTISVEPPPKPQDEKKKDEKKQDDQKQDDQKQDDQKQDDQKKDDQQQQDQHQQQAQNGQQDQQKQDQQGQPQDGQDQQQAQNDRQKQDQQGQPQGSQKPEDQKPEDQKPDGQQQDASVAQGGKEDPKGQQQGRPAATARWLESLPAEDRDALRDQLLRRASPPSRKGNPW